jgi:hypothetical protein
MVIRIVLLVIIIFLLVTAVQKVIMAFFRTKLASLVDRRFAGRQIILMTLNANFFGLAGKGAGQVRGNGALVLTSDELWFCLAAPTREISIPLDKILKVQTSRSHLGKTIFRPLLLVTFDNQDQADQIAWYVKDHKKWLAAIEDLRK